MKRRVREGEGSVENHNHLVAPEVATNSVLGNGRPDGFSESTVDSVYNHIRRSRFRNWEMQEGDRVVLIVVLSIVYFEVVAACMMSLKGWPAN